MHSSPDHINTQSRSRDVGAVHAGDRLCLCGRVGCVSAVGTQSAVTDRVPIRDPPYASTDCGPAGRENCFESHRPRRPAAGAAAAVRSAHRVRLNLLHRFHVSRSSQRRDHHPVAASDSPRVFAPPYNICASFDSDLETCAQSLPMSTQVGRLRANYASRAQSDVLTAFSTATASALSLSVSLDLFTVLLCSKCTGARCV